jgi:hypothetical protein
MFKLGHCVDGIWRQYSHPSLFSVMRTESDREKVLTAAPGGDVLIFATLADQLTPPFFLLYILHTPRGEGSPGRYRSGEMSREEVHEFLQRYADLLKADARFDLWLHAAADPATIVWDRHDLIHAYGPTDSYIAALRGLGFEAGEVAIPVPHEHHYNPACDEQARAVMESGWCYSPLRPEDEQ